MTKDRSKPEITPDGFGQGSQVTVIQVDDAPTALADQVMVRLVGHDLVLGTLPAEVDLAEDPQVAQSLQRTVHRGEMDARLGIEYPLMHPLGAGVTVELAESLQDEDSLASHPAAGPADVVYQGLQIGHGGLAAKIRNSSIQRRKPVVKRGLQ